MVGACAGTMRWLEVLAVSVYTLAETGSAFSVAMMYFARTGPTLLCAPLAGALAERAPRRIVLGIGCASAALLSATLAWLAVSEALALWQVAAGAVLSGVFWSLEHTVRRTIARDVVVSDTIGNAISLDSSTQNATRMLGPLAGGTLYAAIGMPGAYALGALMYGVAALLVLTMSVRLPATVRKNHGLFRALAEVLGYIARERVVAAVLSITVCLNLFGSPYVSMVPVIGREVLALNPFEIGMLMAFEGGGAMCGAGILAFMLSSRFYLPLFTLGAIGFVGGIFAFSLATSFVTASISLAVCGLGLGAFAAMQSTILLTHTRAEMRGRVMGMLAVTIGAGPIGTLVLGVGAESFGAPDALAVSAGIGLAAFVMVILRWPELLRVTR